MGIVNRIFVLAHGARRFLRLKKSTRTPSQSDVDARTEKERQSAARIAASLDYFRSLKNSHAGRRGFVIGNGPSLRFSDLDRLCGEITIASNKVFLAYSQTRWRPTLYTVADPLVWSKVHSVLEQYQPLVIIPSYLDMPSDVRVDVKTFRFLGCTADAKTVDSIPFSNDACLGFYGGYTVTFENLQLAAHLGLNPIYIIGCDHYYAGESGIKKDSPVITGQQQNHFLPGYRSPGEVVNPAPIAEMTHSYESAQRFALRQGIQIFNASRGGHLEVFPRISLDMLL